MPGRSGAGSPNPREISGRPCPRARCCALCLSRHRGAFSRSTRRDSFGLDRRLLKFRPSGCAFYRAVMTREIMAVQIMIAPRVCVLSLPKFVVGLATAPIRVCVAQSGETILIWRDDESHSAKTLLQSRISERTRYRVYLVSPVNATNVSKRQIIVTIDSCFLEKSRRYLR